MTTELATERLTKDLKIVARDAEDLIKATANDVSDKAKEARHRLMGALESAKETLQEKAAAGVKAANEAIHEHPYRSVGVASGVAFGLGLLIGVLANRRNNN